VTVVIIGPPGSGKSSVGRRLARKLSRQFIDTDQRVVAEHGPIAEIFAHRGEEHFRQLERKQVRRALTKDAVVALGGGAVLDVETQRDLSAHTVVLLSVTADSVGSRLNDTRRPLVNDLDSWISLVESRRALYESLADLAVDTSNRDTGEIVAEIASWLRNHE